MAVGAGYIPSFPSYLGIIREASYGTYVTATTAGLEFISCSLKTKKENKVVENITSYRVMSNTIGLGRTVAGDIEHYFDPKSLAACYLLQNALGGAAVTSATFTGDTVGSYGWVHTMVLGNFDTATASLSVNMRKGDSASAKIFEYCGLRVNDLELSSALNAPLKMKYALVGKDSSVTTNDISANLVSYAENPLSFVNGRLSLEGTFASLTTSSFWHVQSITMKLANNLKTDERRIGSDTIEVLPPGTAKIDLEFKIRFDTTTAYNYMLAGTIISGEMEFLGDTLTGSKAQQGVKLQFPKIVVTEALDPEVTGPNEVLMQNIKCVVLRDISSSTGYAIKAYVTNGLSAI